MAYHTGANWKSFAPEELHPEAFLCEGAPAEEEKRDGYTVYRTPTYFAIRYDCGCCREAFRRDPDRGTTFLAFVCDACDVED